MSHAPQETSAGRIFVKQNKSMVQKKELEHLFLSPMSIFHIFLKFINKKAFL